ncbi:hypothetical protein AB4114_11295 [Paenibacillus sp. 2RAB27]|uniref:hypothetical protein n=1 Tax=Paenibacillus sp. 2RAB27 TaxID=3232991 RepID=UPI003F9D0CB9
MIILEIPVIQSVTVASIPNRKYEVGCELSQGRVIIEIVDAGTEYEDHTESLYHVYGEDRKLIATIENCPVIVEYQQIVIDESEDK